MSTVSVSAKMRADGRGPNDLRPVVITPNINKHAEGSAMI
jgi:ribonuclease PH